MSYARTDSYKPPYLPRGMKFRRRLLKSMKRAANDLKKSMRRVEQDKLYKMRER